jgi:hypothetical protein
MHLLKPEAKSPEPLISSNSLRITDRLHAKDPLPRRMAETGFAAGRLLKRGDSIPDHVGEIGPGGMMRRYFNAWSRRNKAQLHRTLAKCIELAAGNKAHKDFSIR